MMNASEKPGPTTQAVEVLIHHLDTHRYVIGHCADSGEAVIVTGRGLHHLLRLAGWNEGDPDMTVMVLVELWPNQRYLDGESSNPWIIKDWRQFRGIMLPIDRFWAGQPRDFYALMSALCVPIPLSGLTDDDVVAVRRWVDSAYPDADEFKRVRIVQLAEDELAARKRKILSRVICQGACNLRDPIGEHASVEFARLDIGRLLSSMALRLGI